MKIPRHLCVVLVLAVLGSILLSSCSQTEPLTTTVKPAPDGTTTTVPVTFTTSVPEIPHVYLIVDPSNPYIQGLVSETGGAICFVCHGYPPNHMQWEADPNICADCHKVSDNPVLVPRGQLDSNLTAGLIRIQNTTRLIFLHSQVTVRLYYWFGLGYFGRTKLTYLSFSHRQCWFYS